MGKYRNLRKKIVVLKCNLMWNDGYLTTKWIGNIDFFLFFFLHKNSICDYTVIHVGRELRDGAFSIAGPGWKVSPQTNPGLDTRMILTKGGIITIL